MATIFDKKAQQLVHLAESAAESCSNWTDIHNAVFAPGVLDEKFPDRTDRERFVRSSYYRRIIDLAESARAREAEGLPSGKFMLRLPRSLHGLLADEAEREGVSLNQLVLSKLSASTPAKG